MCKVLADQISDGCENYILLPEAIEFFFGSSTCSLTQALVQALTYPGQDSQSYKVTKTSSYGCGYIVWINASLL